MAKAIVAISTKCQTLWPCGASLIPAGRRLAWNGLRSPCCIVSRFSDLVLQLVAPCLGQARSVGKGWLAIEQYLAMPMSSLSLWPFCLSGPCSSGYIERPLMGLRLARQAGQDCDRSIAPSCSLVSQCDSGGAVERCIPRRCA